MLEGLQLLYASKKGDIRNRLAEFKQLWQAADDKKIFAELAFCLCTPQSKATAADLAIRRAIETGSLYDGKAEEIATHLTRSGVRFANNKSRYIHEARQYFSRNGELKIKSTLNLDDLFGLRVWLCENVKGFGMKEASHFLRNIGFGDNLAILDRHILKNLKMYGVISAIPKTLGKPIYLEIDERVRKFSQRVRIPMAEIDLLFWSEETGQIFK